MKVVPMVQQSASAVFFFRLRVSSPVIQQGLPYTGGEGGSGATAGAG